MHQILGMKKSESLGRTEMNLRGKSNNVVICGMIKKFVDKNFGERRI